MVVPSCPFAIKWLLDKPYENEFILREQNLSLKCCLLLEEVLFNLRRFRYLHTSNIESVCQRAAKLPAVEVRGLNKKSAGVSFALS